MLDLQNIMLNKQALHQGRLNVFVFTLLTLVSLLFGQTTIFYLIYFFWCNELINMIVDRIFYRRYTAVVEIHGYGSLFVMAIYGVFILVFFGLIANWKNNDLIMVNLEILFLKNWFFNINLLFVLAERIYLHKTKQPMLLSFGSFTANMIVLHISIIVGGLLMFFIVKNYPTIFTSDNLWGSIIIILPFLLLKIAVNHYSKPNVNIKT